MSHSEFLDAGMFGNEREVPSEENLGVLQEALKHEEAIQRHIEKCNLAPGPAALYVWSKGSQGQKVAMIGRLPTTFGELDEGDVSRLLQEFNDTMWSQDVEAQIATPKALGQLLEKFTESQLLTIETGCETMLSVSSEEVRRAWSKLVLRVVGALPVPSLLKVIVPLTLKKSEHSQPSDQRELTPRLIGALCARLDAATLGATVLSKGLSLCQDTDIRMRVGMCNQLSVLMRAVGERISKDKITKELLELLDDEEKLVTKAAFSCLVDVIDFFDPAYRQELLYPIVRSYLQSPPADIQGLLAEEYGKFLLKVRADMSSNEDTILLANFFKQISHSADATTRRWAAFNLPAVVSVLSAVYTTHIAGATRSLAGDTNVPVRRSLAAGLRELVSILGTKAAVLLKEPFLQLVRDPSMDVRQNIIVDLPTYLPLFNENLPREERPQLFEAALPGIIGYATLFEKTSWRRVDSVLSCMDAFPVYFSSSAIKDTLLPFLFSSLKDGAAPVRRRCAFLIASFASQLHNSALTAEVFQRAHQELRKSQSCYLRVSFVLLFNACSGLFSRRVLRERWVGAMADLQRDPVALVRRAVANALPAWKGVLRGCTDTSYVQGYEGARQRLMMDDDDLVRAAAQEALQSIAADDADMERLKVRDEEDKRREVDEGNLVDMVKDQKINERRTKLMELLKEGDVEGTARRVPSNLSSKYPASKSVTKIPTCATSKPRYGSVTSTTTGSSGTTSTRSRGPSSNAAGPRRR